MSVLCTCTMNAQHFIIRFHSSQSIKLSFASLHSTYKLEKKYSCVRNDLMCHLWQTICQTHSATEWNLFDAICYVWAVSLPHTYMHILNFRTEFYWCHPIWCRKMLLTTQSTKIRCISKFPKYLLNINSSTQNYTYILWPLTMTNHWWLQEDKIQKHTGRSNHDRIIGH